MRNQSHKKNFVYHCCYCYFDTILFLTNKAKLRSWKKGGQYIYLTVDVRTTQFYQRIKSIQKAFSLFIQSNKLEKKYVDRI